MPESDQIKTNSYLIGGGTGSLAAAAHLIRDSNLLGSKITIYEAPAAARAGPDEGGHPAWHRRRAKPSPA